MTMLAVLGAIVLIAVCGVSGYFMFDDQGTPKAASSSKPATKSSAPSKSPSPTRSPIDISSRATDPEPLTVKELFGDKTISINDNRTGKTRSYKVVKKQQLKNCTKAVTGDLKSLFKKLDCNQVVRAAINTSNGKYGATAGALNLKEKGSGAKVNPLVKKDDDNSFNGLEGPGASAKINKASGALYWQEHGHYMVYVLICRGDGRQIKLDDTVKQIATDLLINHLTTKLAERTGTVDN